MIAILHSLSFYFFCVDGWIGPIKSGSPGFGAGKHGKVRSMGSLGISAEPAVCGISTKIKIKAGVDATFAEFSAIFFIISSVDLVSIAGGTVGIGGAPPGFTKFANSTKTAATAPFKVNPSGSMKLTGLFPQKT